MAEPELIARIDGSLGRVTLNRPRSINALTPTMIGDLHAVLRGWADDPAVAAVCIDGAGSRGLCAGGDIKVLYDGIVGNTVVPLEFWTHEYEMNATIATYPKPYLALMDGLVLGGGLGVSVHGSVRVVTERSLLAMPETAIGLAPDVGSLYWLARCPGGVGTYAALTGARLNAADALSAGLADVFCPVDALPALVSAARDGVFPVPRAGGLPPGELPVPTLGPDERAWIDACFLAESVPEIADRLADRSEPGAAAALATLRAMSPTAVLVTFEAIRRAVDLPTVVDVLAQDLRVSTEFTRHPDLAEGIRAMVIDKDRQPRWRPDRWEDVSDADVSSFFR